MSTEVTLYRQISEIDSEEELRETIERIKKQINDIEMESFKVNRDISESFEILKRENSSYEAMYEKMLDEVSDLEDELNLGIEEEPPTKKKDADPDLKLLYRKISSMAHPDKTNDGKLHELYIEAKKAYETGDMSRIEYLYATLVTGGDMDFSVDNRSKLQKAIDSLNEELQKQKAELESLYNSAGYKIHRRFKSPIIPKQIKARHHYNELLFRKIEDVAEKKQRLLKIKNGK
jgi:uncharacterized membrane-anchored protein YhcB (DUF1043 family)